MSFLKRFADAENISTTDNTGDFVNRFKGAERNYVTDDGRWEILDGDTIREVETGKSYRLAGSNAAETAKDFKGELGQFGGVEVKNRLLDIANSRGLNIESSGEYGKYGREVVRYLDNNGVDIGGELVRQGQIFRDFDPTGRYADEQYLANLDARDPSPEYQEKANQRYLATNIPQPTYYSKSGTFARSVDRGIDQTQAMLYGAANAVGELMGFDALSEWGLEGVERNLKEASYNPAEIASYEDVESLSDAWTYVVEAIGEQAPQLAIDLVAGVATGGMASLGSMAARAGAAKALKRKIGEERFGRLLANKRYQRQQEEKYGGAFGKGFKYGVLGGMQSQMTGEVQLEFIEQGLDAPGTAIATGAVNTLIEFKAMKKLIEPILKNAKRTGSDAISLRDALGTALRQAGIGVPTEGLTEMAQTFITKSAAMAIGGQSAFSDEAYSEYINAGLKGGIVGGTLSGGASLLDSARQKMGEGYVQSLQEADDAINSAAAGSTQASAETGAGDSQSATGSVQDQVVPGQTTADVNAPTTSQPQDYTPPEDSDLFDGYPTEFDDTPPDDFDDIPEGDYDEYLPPETSDLFPEPGEQPFDPEPEQNLDAQEERVGDPSFKDRAMFISKRNRTWGKRLDDWRNRGLPYVAEDDAVVLFADQQAKDEYEQIAASDTVKARALVKGYTQDIREVNPGTAMTVQRLDSEGRIIEEEAVDPEQVDQAVANQSRRAAQGDQVRVVPTEQAMAERQQEVAEQDQEVGAQPVAGAEQPASASPTQQLEESDTTQATPFINHSGGAAGSDSVWGQEGEAFGVQSNHYFYDHPDAPGKRPPAGNSPITQEQYAEGLKEAHRVADQWGYSRVKKAIPASLLSRNWQQVKNADAVFAIVEGFERAKSGVIKAKGGTAYAIQMAINHGKPVFAFSQPSGNWYSYSPEDNKWNQVSTPTLTPNFAGIGTRKINDAGRQAIRDVYQLTFAGQKKPAGKKSAGKKGSKKGSKKGTDKAEKAAATNKAITDNPPPVTPEFEQLDFNSLDQSIPDDLPSDLIYAPNGKPWPVLGGAKMQASIYGKEENGSRQFDIVEVEGGYALKEKNNERPGRSGTNVSGAKGEETQAADEAVESGQERTGRDQGAQGQDDAGGTAGIEEKRAGSRGGFSGEYFQELSIRVTETDADVLVDHYNSIDGNILSVAHDYFISPLDSSVSDSEGFRETIDLLWDLTIRKGFSQDQATAVALDAFERYLDSARDETQTPVNAATNADSYRNEGEADPDSTDDAELETGVGQYQEGISEVEEERNTSDDLFARKLAKEGTVYNRETLENRLVEIAQLFPTHEATIVKVGNAFRAEPAHKGTGHEGKKRFNTLADAREFITDLTDDGDMVFYEPRAVDGGYVVDQIDLPDTLAPEPASQDGRKRFGTSNPAMLLKHAIDDAKRGALTIERTLVRMWDIYAHRYLDKKLNTKLSKDDSKPLTVKVHGASPFSNSAVRPFRLAGMDFISVDHAYVTLGKGTKNRQAYKEFQDRFVAAVNKALSAKDKAFFADLPNDSGKSARETQRDYILQNPRRFLNKNVFIPVHKIAADDKPNWGIMHDLIQNSFTQNPEAATRLAKATGNRPIALATDNKNWANRFPQVLELTRYNIRRELEERKTATFYQVDRTTGEYTMVKMRLSNLASIGLSLSGDSDYRQKVHSYFEGFTNAIARLMERGYIPADSGLADEKIFFSTKDTDMQVGEFRAYADKLSQVPTRLRRLYDAKALGYQLSQQMDALQKSIQDKQKEFDQAVKDASEGAAQELASGQVAERLSSIQLKYEPKLEVLEQRISQLREREAALQRAQSDKMKSNDQYLASLERVYAASQKKYQEAIQADRRDDNQRSVSAATAKARAKAMQRKVRAALLKEQGVSEQDTDLHRITLPDDARTLDDTEQSDDAPVKVTPSKAAAAKKALTAIEAAIDKLNISNLRMPSEYFQVMQDIAVTKIKHQKLLAEANKKVSALMRFTPVIAEAEGLNRIRGELDDLFYAAALLRGSLGANSTFIRNTSADLRELMSPQHFKKQVENGYSYQRPDGELSERVDFEDQALLREDDRTQGIAGEAEISDQLKAEIRTPFDDDPDLRNDKKTRTYDENAQRSLLEDAPRQPDVDPSELQTDTSGIQLNADRVLPPSSEDPRFDPPKKTKAAKIIRARGDVTKDEKDFVKNVLNKLGAKLGVTIVSRSWYNENHASLPSHRKLTANDKGLGYHIPFGDQSVIVLQDLTQTKKANRANRMFILAHELAHAFEQRMFDNLTDNQKSILAQAYKQYADQGGSLNKREWLADKVGAYLYDKVSKQGSFAKEDTVARGMAARLRTFFRAAADFIKKRFALDKSVNQVMDELIESSAFRGLIENRGKADPVPFELDASGKQVLGPVLAKMKGLALAIKKQTSKAGVAWKVSTFLRTSDSQLRDLDKDYADAWHLAPGSDKTLYNRLTFKKLNGGFHFRVLSARGRLWSEFIDISIGNKSLKDYYHKPNGIFSIHEQVRPEKQQEVVKAIKELNDGGPYTTDFARLVRKALDTLHSGYLRHALPTMGYLQNYFPVVMNTMELTARRGLAKKIMVKHKAEQWTRQQVQRYEDQGKDYDIDNIRSKMFERAENVAEEVIENILNGGGSYELAVLMDQSVLGPGFVHNRARDWFSSPQMVAELNKHTLMETDFAKMMFNYVAASVKRAEFERGFGGYSDIDGALEPTYARKVINDKITLNPQLTPADMMDIEEKKRQLDKGARSIEKAYAYNILGIDPLELKIQLQRYINLRGTEQSTDTFAKFENLIQQFEDGLSGDQYEKWAELKEMVNSAGVNYHKLMLDKLVGYGYMKVASGYLSYYSPAAGIRGYLENIYNTHREAGRKRAETLTRANLGQLGSEIDPDVQAAMSTIMAYESVLVLAFSTLSSFPDIVGGVLRNRDISGMFNAMREMGALWRKQAFSRDEYKMLVDEVREVGLIGQRISQAVLQEMFGSSYTSENSQKVLDALFHFNGQEAWTNYTRVVNYQLAKSSIKRWVVLAKKKDPKAFGYLQEFGLTVAEYDKWDGKAFKAADVAALDNLTGDARRKQKEKLALRAKVQAAHLRFVEESVVRPDASQRPAWASDPRFMLIWHLKSFFYSYGKIIVLPFLQSVQKQMKPTTKTSSTARNIKIYGTTVAAGALPLITASVLLFGLAAFGWEARELLQYSLFGKEGRTDTMPWDSYLFELSSRAGVYGPAELAMNLGSGYGDSDRRAAALLGPSFDHLVTLLKEDWDQKVYRSTPFLNQLPGAKQWLSE